MNDEDSNNTITSDDIDALRILLHSVRGLSAVSTVADYAIADDVLDE
jgi:hypothetical protein